MDVAAPRCFGRLCQPEDGEMQDANAPVPMEVYPSLAFDGLFDNQGNRRTLSSLDRVKNQATATLAGL